jgi:hypothetical protein
MIQGEVEGKYDMDRYDSRHADDQIVTAALKWAIFFAQAGIV